MSKSAACNILYNLHEVLFGFWHTGLQCGAIFGVALFIHHREICLTPEQPWVPTVKCFPFGCPGYTETLKFRRSKHVAYSRSFLSYIIMKRVFASRQTHLLQYHKSCRRYLLSSAASQSSRCFCSMVTLSCVFPLTKIFLPFVAHQKFQSVRSV